MSVFPSCRPDFPLPYLSSFPCGRAQVLVHAEHVTYDLPPTYTPTHDFLSRVLFTILKKKKKADPLSLPSL